MGIHDRDYYRKSGPSFLGRFADHGTVCKWLVTINVVVFVLQLVSTTPHVKVSPLVQWLALDTSAVMHGEVWRLLTYGFLHSTGSFLHILFNMLFLWWFGHDVEDIYGPREFLCFYLTATVVGGLAYLAATLLGVGAGVCIGASGAVTAVMLVFACHYPTRTILVMMVLPVSIWLFVVFEVAMDVFGLLNPAGTVAVSCHLGGAAFGFLYYKGQWRLSNFLPGLKAWTRRRSRPRLRLYREEEPLTPVGAPAAPRQEDEQLEARMDAILEKISRSGKESLTDSERETLLRASEALRRRRT